VWSVRFEPTTREPRLEPHTLEIEPNLGIGPKDEFETPGGNSDLPNHRTRVDANLGLTRDVAAQREKADWNELTSEPISKRFHLA